MNIETATPKQRTEAMRKALATIIAEKVDATNKSVTAKLASGGVDDSFNALMFEAGSNVGLLTQALGRVMVFDDLIGAVQLLYESAEKLGLSELRLRAEMLIAQATRDGG